MAPETPTCRNRLTQINKLLILVIAKKPSELGNMGDAFLPSTVRFARRIINWLEGYPKLYNFMYGLAVRHDRAMGFRRFGTISPETGVSSTMVLGRPDEGRHYPGRTRNRVRGSETTH